MTTISSHNDWDQLKEVVVGDVNLSLCVNNNKFTENKNIVRNIYYKEILQDTDTVQPNLRPYLDVLIDLFNSIEYFFI